jgi:2,4-dienoyl-CoA reductase-like NADH-dependent reductase (Old Yellow Enzyme family)
MPSNAPLFDTVTFGAFEAPNRIVMAPLTRTRAGADGVPTDAMVEYYRQRAGQGLIVSEGVWPAAEGKSYPGQPGIETPEQIEETAQAGEIDLPDDILEAVGACLAEAPFVV